MSIKRKSFVLHIDSLDVLDELTDEQAGQLFKAIKSYQISEAIECSCMIKIAFSPFKNQFERDNEKYLALCEKNRLIAENRYKYKATKSTTGASGDQALPAATKSTDNDSDSDSDSDKEKIKDKKHYVGNESEKLFDKFWQAGTKKGDKKKANKSFLRELKKHSNKSAFVDMLIFDLKKRLSLNQLGFENMHQTTYLNNQRWEDEHEKSNGSNQQGNGGASDAAQALRDFLGEDDEFFNGSSGKAQQDDGSIVASYDRTVRN